MPPWLLAAEMRAMCIRRRSLGDAHVTVLDEIEELESRVGKMGAVARAIRELKLRDERRRQSGPGGLLHFIRYFWRVVEPNRLFVEGWALDAMCLHLEAVDAGRIRKLLITVPPGSMKSLLCSVFFPVWQWSARDKPWMRYLNFSYAAHLTERDNERMVAIIKSPEFQELWGPRDETYIDERNGRRVTVRKGFSLTSDGKTKPANDKTGWKFATSVGGVGTGERGDCVILDDAHSIKDDNSEVVRPETVRWFKEAMSNRLNDMDKSAIIVIMQRSHEADVAGTIIDERMGYVHLNIPMEFEADNRCVTPIWSDPRQEDGEIFWPERFGPQAVADIKALGDHVWVGQYQQRPEPRGGGLFKRADWRSYIPRRDALGRETWPDFDFTVASVDSAFTEKTSNDPTGFTIWGVFQNDEGSWCALLKQAWRKHLTLRGRARSKLKAESWGDYAAETQKDWGLMQWLRYECTRHRVNTLLIENKANGLDIYHEMLRSAEFDPWDNVAIDPKNLDKWARGMRIQPLFTEGLIYAILGKKYSQLMIDESASFPNGRFRDCTDSMTQALWWLRRNGFLENGEMARERQHREAERAGKQPRAPAALYPV